MDCAQFEKIVHDLERFGTEGFALRESAHVHAESCSRCVRLMTEMESLDAALRALAVSGGELQASRRVETTLIEEFRRRKAVSSRRRVQWQIAALSAAAVLLLALGLSLHYWPAHSSVNARVPSEATKVSPAYSPVAATAGSQQQDAILENQADDSGSASDFVSLPYADDPNALEDGAVVRVVMPRAALASFGFPVAAIESDATVRADMIVSADGTPQAIRLVSQDSTSQSF